MQGKVGMALLALLASLTKAIALGECGVSAGATCGVEHDGGDSPSWKTLMILVATVLIVGIIVGSFAGWRLHGWYVREFVCEEP